MRRERYELRLSRRDGDRMRHEPHPIVETFDITDDRELEEVVGKHFIPMAAAAEGERYEPHWAVREFQHFLPHYQVEVWRTDGYGREPEVVSTSTHGWRD